MKLNIQIADDHKVVVESLRKLIDESDRFQVTDVYYDLHSCRLGLSRSLPDVLLLDIGFPEGDGVEFCGEITKIYPALKIIMLTSYKEFNIAKRALHNGASGYILKNAMSEEVFAGIETVHNGEQFLCEEIDILLREKKGKDVVWLSLRESEIIQYIADGYTTKEIAAIIFLDTETIKTYRRNLFVKLDARNMAELINKGHEMRLIR